MTESEPEGSLPARPPLWITLLLGAVVGFAIGTAWDRIVVGVGLGLLLAILAWLVFR